MGRNQPQVENQTEQPDPEIETLVEQAAADGRALIDGFTAQIESLTAERDSLRQLLAETDAARVALAEQVAALELQLADARPPEPQPEPAPAGPRWWVASETVQTVEAGLVKAGTPFLTAAPKGKTWVEHPG